MSRLRFTYDRTNSIYRNTLETGGVPALAPANALTTLSKNAEDWNDSVGVTISNNETAIIDNPGNQYYYVYEIVHVNQSTADGSYPSDILFRALIQNDGILGAQDDDWGMYATIQAQGGTEEAPAKTALPTGTWPGFWQFEYTISSPLGLAMDYVRPRIRLNNWEGLARVKFLELIDLSSATTQVSGEAQSKPECIYEPVTPVANTGGLTVPLMAFMYGDLDQILKEDSPEKSIELLSEYDYLVCDDPGDLDVTELYITDAIKGSVNIFGYVAMGASAGGTLPTTASLTVLIDAIDVQGWYGVFLDRMGYDWNETRARQTSVVDYVRSKGLIPFGNSWNPEDIFDSTVDATYNPAGDPTPFQSGDWVVIESFVVYESGYWTDIYQMMQKWDKFKDYKASLGVNVAAIARRQTAVTWANSGDDIDLSYIIALGFGFDSWWFSSTSHADEDWVHADQPDMALGSTLTTKWTQVSPYWYMAETDTHIIVADMEDFPPITCTIYDKRVKKTFPKTLAAGTSILYSNDLVTWSEYDLDDPNTVGKFAREKMVFPPPP